MLRVDALSREEWNYLYGLFLTDGYSDVVRGTKFCFASGEEVELAHRVEGMLRRVGLKPRIVFDKRKRMVSVFVYSKGLHTVLPDKGKLFEATEWMRFVDDNKLLSVEFGIPFVAGLMDGDGSCCVYARRKSPFRGQLDRYSWCFGQKKYLFLIEYLNRFVEMLAPGGVYVYSKKANGEVMLFARKSSVEALIGAGITRHSWKAARWPLRIAELRRERMKYYSTRQVADMLHVSVGTVKNWIRRGKLRAVRRAEKSGRSAWWFIPVEEVWRLGKTLRERAEDRRLESARSGGMKIAEVSTLLSIPTQTLYSWYGRGELQATLVHEDEETTPGGHTYLVIPREEVQRLIAERRSSAKEVGNSKA